MFSEMVDLERKDILPQFRENIFLNRKLYKNNHNRSINLGMILNDYLQELDSLKFNVEQIKNKRDKNILINKIKDIEEKIPQIKDEIKQSLIIKRQIQRDSLWNINNYFEEILKERGDKVFNTILLLLERNIIDRPVIENLVEGLNIKDLSIIEKINVITEILNSKNIITEKDYTVYRILVLLLGIYSNIYTNIHQQELPREEKETYKYIHSFLMNEDIYVSGYLNNPMNIDRVERVLGLDTLESSSLKNSRLRQIMRIYHPDKNQYNLPIELTTKIMAFLSEFQTIIGIKMKYLKYKEKYINLKNKF